MCTRSNLSPTLYKTENTCICGRRGYIFCWSLIQRMYFFACSLWQLLLLPPKFLKLFLGINIQETCLCSQFSYFFITLYLVRKTSTSVWQVLYCQKCDTVAEYITIYQSTLVHYTVYNKSHPSFHSYMFLCLLIPSSGRSLTVISSTSNDYKHLLNVYYKVLICNHRCSTLNVIEVSSLMCMSSETVRR